MQWPGEPTDVPGHTSEMIAIPQVQSLGTSGDNLQCKQAAAAIIAQPHASLYAQSAAMVIVSELLGELDSDKFRLARQAQTSLQPMYDFAESLAQFSPVSMAWTR